MDDKSVFFVTAHTFSKLLKRPLRSWMSSDIRVQDSPRIEFHDNKYIHQPKRCGHNDKEVCSDDGFGMIPHESHPALGRVCRTARGLWDVASDRPRRNLNADFKQEFVGDAFLTPGWIAHCYFNDQLLQVGRHTRPAARSRLPLPKQPKAPAMPTNQCIGFDDGEGVPPVEETGEMSESKANGIG